MMDYYRVLEVDIAASEEVIKKAYRALSMKYHPDKLSNAENGDSNRMALVNEAYAVLSDPVRRRRYDGSRVDWDVWLEDGLVGLARNWLSGLSNK